MRTIEISDETYRKLQQFAIPLEDGPTDVIERALSALANVQRQPRKRPSEENGKHSRKAPAPWAMVNWRLPNNDLADAWNLTRQQVATRRQNGRHGSATWRQGEDNEQYRDAKNDEYKKAQQHFASKQAPQEEQPA